MINPSTFFINLTNKCTFNCSHCYAFKDDIIMSRDTLTLALKYIVKEINSSDEFEYYVNFTGGEAGLYNQKYILDSITYIKEQCPNKRILFIYQTGLFYELTEEHLEVLKEIDDIGISYDAGDIRFKSYAQKDVWFKNLQCIKDTIQCAPIRMSIVATKPMILTEPAIIFDFLRALDIHTLEINSMLVHPLNGKDLTTVAPNTKELRDWLYKTFIEYEKVRKYYNVEVMDLECIRQSFEGQHNLMYSRQCCQKNRTIMPDGKVATCVITQSKPIYDLITDEYIGNNCAEWCETESKIPEMCTNCKYLKYCQGGCQFYLYDEYGCSTPHKIYDYLETQKELLNE